MSPKERHALALLATVGLLGHGIRLLALAPDSPPGGVTLLTKSESISLADHRARSAQAGRALAPGERIDLNSAPAHEIARLPKLGPAVARAIVQARVEGGGFSSLADLDRIPGIGPILLAAIAPHAGFGDTNRIRRAPPSVGGRARAVSPAPPLAPLVAVSAESGPSGPASGPSTGPPVRVNSATERDLMRLPGIGSARAKAILAYRQANGPFASVGDLEKVPGLTRRLVRQLASQVVVP
jgi:competence ComEA-like helix-hairpin-helix protein